MHKKAFISEPLVFLVSVLTFFIAAFVFFLLFTSSGCSNKTFERSLSAEFSLEPEAEYMLMVFMKTPFDYDLDGDGEKENVTGADIIVDAVENDDYGNTGEVLESYLDRTGLWWQVTIQDLRSGDEKDFRRRTFKRTTKPATAELLIPGYEKDGVIMKLAIAPGESSLALAGQLADEGWK